ARDRLSAGDRLRRDVGRQSRVAHGHGHLRRVSRQASRLRASRRAPAVSRPHRLVAQHQPVSRPALGTRAGDVRRGPVSHRPDGGAVHPRAAGRRSQVLQDHRDREAFRRALWAGATPPCVRRGREYGSLLDAVHQGLITEQAIDSAVTRLFLARFRLGMFDPPDSVRWARIPISALDEPSHRALALAVARESIVLLKNARSLLPLRSDLGTIAVIGPNADQWRMLLGNYNGIPADPVTPLRGIREAVSPRTRVLYALGSDLA